jgi:hypothetical protein
MLRLRIPMALILAAAVIALTSSSVAAHNAGCVQTGSGEWVFVGSNKESPAVPEQNPNSRDDPVRGGNFLDLQPDGPGDQFGARSAADQGNSAVARPNPNVCEAMGPREDNSP